MEDLDPCCSLSLFSFDRFWLPFPLCCGCSSSVSVSCDLRGDLLGERDVDRRDLFGLDEFFLRPPDLFLLGERDLFLLDDRDLRPDELLRGDRDLFCDLRPEVEFLRDLDLFCGGFLFLRPSVLVDLLGDRDRPFEFVLLRRRLPPWFFLPDLDLERDDDWLPDSSPLPSFWLCDDFDDPFLVGFRPLGVIL